MVDFFVDKVSCGELIYGVIIGFGFNVDKLFGVYCLCDELLGGNLY